MIGLLHRNALCLEKSLTAGARFLSTPTRRLITKGIVSPINPHPSNMIVPIYVSSNKDEPSARDISVVNDYVDVTTIPYSLGNRSRTQRGRDCEEGV